MNRRISIIILNNLVCIASVCAQNTSNKPIEKPATDACPSWNNKQTISKADYFQFLRKSPKAVKTNNIAQYNQRNKSFDQPIYSSRIPQKNIPAVEPEPTEVDTLIKEKSEQKEEIPVSIPSVNVNSDKELQTVKPEPQIIPQVEIVKTTVKDSSSNEEKKDAIEKPDSNKKHTLFKFHKGERKHWLRKIHFRKKGAAKCPDF